MGCFNKQKSQWPNAMKFLIHTKPHEDVSDPRETCMRLFRAQIHLSCASTHKTSRVPSGFSAPGWQTGKRV